MPIDDSSSGDDAPTLAAGAVAHTPNPTGAGELAVEATAPSGHSAAYRLRRRVGEGGMGEVWEAEQTAPMRRRVAVKLLKLGMDTHQFVARFESERQALALMEHPAIARVLDGGATAAGRPYFVMEYVEGAPITEHCDRERLGLAERIELFLAVCDGVQHAHQKGVIHRDLKPSNLLVAEVDGKPAPKIIDFGLAKAISAGESTVHTVVGGWIGTPAYMSPEQAENSGDVDTRSDVYSLGVVLYELLTGFRPFEARSPSGVDEMRRLIREVEPPRPSTRVQAAGGAASAAAERRRTEPRALARRLRGDLDWIVTQALEKEKERRYGSPAELAADLRRHLDSQPVVAGPPSPAYRARKFVRRHRVIVAAAAAVALALVVAVAGTTVGFVRARDEARRANRAAANAEATAAFLAGLFESGDPSEADRADLSARDILERGTERLETELADQPGTRARLLETIGAVYRNLGLLEESEAALRRSLELRRGLASGPERGRGGAADGPTTKRDVAGALLALGTTVKERGRFEEAEVLFDEARSIMEASLGRDDPLRLSILTGVGLLYRDRGERDRAQPLLEDAVAEARRMRNVAPSDLATALNNLALHYRSSQRPELAEPLFAEAIAIVEGAPQKDRFALLAMYNNLGLVYGDLERWDDASRMYDRSLAVAESVLGADHPRVAIVLHNQADVLRAQGSFERAGPLYERSRRILEERLGLDHPNVATSLIGSAQLLATSGRLEQAAAELERAIAIREAAFGDDSPRVHEPLEEYARVLRRLGREPEAVAVESRLAELQRSSG